MTFQMNKVTLILAVAMTLAAPATLARPDHDQKMDTSLLQRQDLAYRFHHFDLDSFDGQRHYRLWVGKPERPAPLAGYPVLWMLDGNAAIGALNPELLKQLSAGQAPLLVAVGYQTDQRIERSSRTYDYTPTIHGQTPQLDPLTGQPSGGVDEFFELLRHRMRPIIERSVPIDLTRQTLWGHSYGALAVLHALFNHPAEFSDYVAASPSLWWHEGAILSEAAGLQQRLGNSRPRLLLLRGDREPTAPGCQTGDDGVRQARTLAMDLAKIPSVQVRFEQFIGLGHGQMLPASLHTVIESMSK